MSSGIAPHDCCLALPRSSPIAKSFADLNRCRKVAHPATSYEAGAIRYVGSAEAGFYRRPEAIYSSYNISPTVKRRRGMQNSRSTGGSSRDALGPVGTMVLGDGAATGLVFVSRSLLDRICEDAQARARTGPHEHFEIGGLLIGPKPQNGELRVDEAIPLGFEY